MVTRHFQNHLLTKRSFPKQQPQGRAKRKDARALLRFSLPQVFIASYPLISIPFSSEVAG